MEMHFTDQNFVTEVEQSKGVVLVDFSAAWCGPCQQQAPIIAKIASEYAGKAKIGTLDVDVSPETAEKFGVTAIPTLIIFKDGKPQEMLQGFQPDGKLRTKLDAQLQSAA
jgi:thioredoxin 1